MDDLISRQAAIDAAKDWYNGLIVGSFKSLEKRLQAVPSEQPKRKKGHWERHNTYHGDDISGYVDPDWRCSECGGQANVNVLSLYDLTDFCPNCGADMRGEHDD